MHKNIRLSVLFLLLLFVMLNGCSGESYDNEDIIAVLAGKEIKAKDILARYPLDDEHIDIYLKEEIIINEAKKEGIQVSEEEIESHGFILGEDYSDVIERFSENKDFYEKQAKKLDLTPEEYYEIWNEANATRDPYIQKYAEEHFLNDAITDGIDLIDLEETKKLDKEIDDHLNELLELYEDTGELEIKK